MKIISEKQFNEKIDAIWQEYLLQATPEDLHQTVMNKNYDDVYTGGDGEKDMQWIVDNPKTEKATALMLYWMLGARGVVDIFPLLDSLENNLLNNFYSTKNLGFNPKNDHENYNWTLDYTKNAMQRTIPPILEEAIEGKILLRSNDFVEGLPMLFYEKIESIFENYEIEEED